MSTLLRMWVLPTLAFAATLSNAQSLGPGSPAPALDVKAWYKGKPVTKLEKGKTYVVEFWATWCGPCKTSIPHLTELAKKNKDVQFIGVSIWEDDKGGNIKNFVKEMGAKMDYNVGYSGNKTGMSKTWMEAAGQNGIPSAFVVKDQKVMWIGHPMEMEKPLAEIKSGKFNVAAFKKDFAKKAEAAKAEQANQTKLMGISKLIKDGKYAEATTQLDEIEKQLPAMASATATYRLQILAKTDPAAWETKATALANGNEEQKGSLAIFALTVAESKSDPDLCRKAIEMLLGSAKESDTMTYYYAGTVYSMLDDYRKAIEMMDKAIESLPKGMLKDSPQAKEALKAMRDEFAKKVKG